jgi:hypothetical protein
LASRKEERVALEGLVGIFCDIYNSWSGCGRKDGETEIKIGDVLESRGTAGERVSAVVVEQYNVISQ